MHTIFKRGLTGCLSSFVMGKGLMQAGGRAAETAGKAAGWLIVIGHVFPRSACLAVNQAQSL